MLIAVSTGSAVSIISLSGGLWIGLKTFGSEVLAEGCSARSASAWPRLFLEMEPMLDMSAWFVGTVRIPFTQRPMTAPEPDLNANDAELVARLALASREFDTTGADLGRNCWMAVHRHVHGVLPSEYDIREVPEALYLAVLAHRRELA